MTPNHPVFQNPNTSTHLCHPFRTVGVALRRAACGALLVVCSGGWVVVVAASWEAEPWCMCAARAQKQQRSRAPHSGARTSVPSWSRLEKPRACWCR